ncbi:DMT family transporter [Novosphingobium terrae]|uniref:DMT family transporter n=1 Tax=Novosphingobium terrae TaxID=2726189 RepID=UPI001F130747|nr:DMT family transporter [Novosphingobium terrae]
MTASLATPSGDNRTMLGIACGMGAGALWGLVFLAPALLREVAPLQQAIGRYLAYGLISAVLLAPRWRALKPSLMRRDWLSLLWLSLAGNTLYYVLLSTAVQKAGIATTSLIIGFLPVAVTIIGSRDRHAVPLGRLLPSILLCVAGVICIGWQALAPSTPGDSGQRGLGFLCAIGALISWTAYAVGNARCLARNGHISAHDWNLLTGVVTGTQALLLIPLSALVEPLRHTPAVWVQLAIVSCTVAVLASLVGNALWNRMSRLLPLTMVGQMILFETLFALLYGLIWEHRLPLPLEVAAFALVMTSVLTCIAAHRRHAAGASPAEIIEPAL